MNVESIRPFGPTIIRSKLPDEMLEQIERYVDDVCSDAELMNYVSTVGGNVPNALETDVHVIYLTEKFSDDIGLTGLLESLGNHYLDLVQPAEIPDWCELPDEGVKLGVISGDDKEFAFSENVCYSDCWVNRYFQGDYAPHHNHGGVLSGVVFLKVPDEIKLLNKSVDGNLYRRLSGRLQFLYGCENPFCSDSWTPDQEDGMILIFPSWLPHLVNPQKTFEERRTLSFNLIAESDYRKAKNTIKE